MEEEWRVIFDNYEVSNWGNVRSKKFIGRGLKKSHTGKDGYLQTGLCYNKRQKTWNIHILVAMAFLGERPEGMVIDHIDRNRTNNMSDNLRYVSNRDNILNSATYKYPNSTPEDKRKRHNEAVSRYYFKKKALMN